MLYCCMKLPFAIFIFLSACVRLSAQENVGILDMGKVMVQMPEYQLAERFYKENERLLEDSAYKLQRQIEIYMRSRHCNHADSAWGRTWTQKLAEMNEHLMFFYQTYCPNERMRRKEQQLKVFTQTLRYQLMDFMAAHHITQLIDKEAVIYFEEGDDYTERVIEYLQLGR